MLTFPGGRSSAAGVVREVIGAKEDPGGVEGVGVGTDAGLVVGIVVGDWASQVGGDWSEVAREWSVRR